MGRQDFSDFVPGDFHRDTFLTNMLVGYRPPGMIAPDIFPVLNVPKASNVFAKVDRGNWMRRPETLRAMGTAPNEVRYTVSSDRYNVENYELATVVPFEVMDNADSPHDPAQRAAEFLIDQLNLDYEIRVSETVWSGVGSTQVLQAGVNAWNNFGGSDPMTDIEAGQEFIRQTTGYLPNRMILPWRVWLKLRRHPDIVRALYPGAGVGGMATLQGFADLIGVDQILVPKAIRVTGPERLQGDDSAETFTDVWSTNVVLNYTAPSPGIMVPTFGYTFRWTGPNIGAQGPGNFTIERRRDPKRKVEEMQTGYYQDEKIVAPELAYQIRTGIV